jgi:hypothetical protein
MQLLTDHPQFYDGIFDRHGPVFHRLAFTRGGLDKPAQFELFHRLGLATPPHGTPVQLARNYTRTCDHLHPPASIPNSALCIVYLDTLAHRGQGKQLLTLDQAQQQCPNAFASMFVPQPGPPAAYRYARLGRLGFWLKQHSTTADWRSNVQDHEDILASLPSQPEPKHPIPRVLWAIDFIPSPAGILAVDFNTAPDLDSLGENHALDPDTVRQELNHCAEHHPNALAQF